MSAFVADLTRLRSSILTLVCNKCTRAQSFGVGTKCKLRVMREIQRAGWIKRGGVTVCPNCPQTLQERARQVASSADAQ
jgi:hypothetical protein